VPRLAPENSAASLAAALDRAAPCVEFDLRPTADGLMVLSHDPTPERITGNTTPVDRLTSRELVDQRLLSDPAETLLLLDEALAMLADRTSLNLEIKTHPPVAAEELAQRTVSALVRAGSPQQVIISSSDLEVLRAAAAIAPRLALGFVAFGDDPRPAVETAVRAGCRVLVVSRRRLDQELIARAKARELLIWSYTIDDPEIARSFYARGVDAVFSDDLPRLQAELSPPTLSAADAPLVLAIDLGSTLTKAALVSPEHGIVRRVSRPTPTKSDGAGLVEHDPAACLAVTQTLIEELRAVVKAPPLAAGLASQRSTGCWIDRQTGAPVTPAPSWRDQRQGSVFAELIERGAQLASEAGLPLTQAWTAVKGRALRTAPNPNEQLVPLGSFVASRLIGRAPFVDPTLANRMFVLSARTLEYSPLLLDALAIERDQLPELRSTIGEHGQLRWSDSERVPWTVLIGDQQAAYVGCAGPTDTRLVLNLGTGTFLMRTETQPRPSIHTVRRAVLWTSDRNRRGPTLVERPLEAPPCDASLRHRIDGRLRSIARELAWGFDQPIRWVDDLVRQIAEFQLPLDQSITVCGGGSASPHLARLLQERSPLTPLFTRERETTLLGVARLAAAACKQGWRYPSGGGVRSRDAV
jgi:sugar (pentulose or hexulose) kinase/glycerophosphoryl diester phosphodiesterase